MNRRKKRSGPDIAARFAFEADVIANEAERAIFDCGVLVKSGAQKLAPVHTGRLKQSYSVKLRRRGNNPSSVVGTVVPYATYVEFARVINGYPYGKNLREPARVLYRALDNNEEEIVRRIDAAVGRALEKVAGP